MSIEGTIQRRRTLLLDALKKGELPKGKLSHITGLHLYVVEDTLELLESERLIEIKNGKWSLIK